MRWTTSPGFRSVVHFVLFLSLSWFVLLALLGDAVEPTTRDKFGPVLFWTTVLSSVITLALWYMPATKVMKPYTQEWRGAATTVIHRTPEQVWNFIRDPAFAALTSPSVEQAFRVPGTPDGPGGQQVFISPGLFGYKAVSILEVTKERPWTWIQVRHLTGGGWSTYLLDAVPAGTELTVTMGNEFLRWQAHRINPRAQLQQAAAEYVQNVKRVIESGAIPPSFPTAPPTAPSHGSSHNPTEQGSTNPTPPNEPPPNYTGNPPPPT